MDAEMFLSSVVWYSWSFVFIVMCCSLLAV